MTLEARAVTSAEPDGARPGRDPADPGPRSPRRVPSQPELEPAPQPTHQPEPERGDEPPEHSIAPRRPRTVGGAVFLLVLAATVAGVAVVALSDWHAGLTLTGGALVLAALARLVLPQSQAGMLGVRRKLVDVTTLLLLGGGLVVLAALIPPRPPL